MSAAELPAPQLGRILIAAGLLSEEQLAQALEEQAQTGRRLGEVIVQRGFISGPALANALAEQHGGVLKTEYGFASGLGGIVARRAAAESGTSVSPLRPPELTPMPTLRTAEPEAVSLAPEEEQAATASEELAQAPLQQEAPEALTPPEPPAEPEQTPEPPPAFEKHPEPEPPPAALSPLSPPEPVAPRPPEPSFKLAEPTEVTEPFELRPPDPEPVQEAPQVFAPEPEVVPSPEPEPTPLAEATEPIPDPVDLRPPSREPEEQPQPVAPEPEFLQAPEPEPTPLAEAFEPIPEPVELRPPVPEPVQEAEPVVPEPFDLPGSHEPEPEQPPAAGLDDRDQLIESLRARVEAQELELAKLREQLEQERARKDVQVHVWPEEQPVPTTPGPVQAEHYLLCVPTAAGYVLLDRVGGLPSVGQAVEVPEEEGRFTVTKVVRLPRNGRPCAYLQRA